LTAVFASGARSVERDAVAIIETSLGATVMRVGQLLIALVLAATPACAQEPQHFPPEQIHLGAEVFARNCSPCHGPHMQDPEGAFDLRTFPPEQHARFVNSVSHGKNAMPPWASLLKPEEIEALWAYVMAGEK
jgi:mono/diheme cytochrome c family protein